MYSTLVIFFFFQAEDGIRDYKVTGVQTCALPISFVPPKSARRPGPRAIRGQGRRADLGGTNGLSRRVGRGPRRAPRGNEIGERRVGKECRSRWSPYH